MKSSSLLGLLVGSIVVTAPALASAQQCVSGPTVLPGLSGPPKWFGTPGATDWRPELNDPRWAAAAARRFGTYTTNSTGTGSLDEALYRILYHGGMLYVSIQMLVDPWVDVGDEIDRVFFAFDKGSIGNHAWAASVKPNRTGAPVAAPGAGVPVDAPLPYDTNDGTFNDWYESPDGSWDESTTSRHFGEKPSWMQDVATWRNAFGGTWAITFKVDIDSLGISSAAGPLRLFVGARRAHLDGTLVVFGSSAPATDDNTVGYTAMDGAVTIIPKDKGTWTQYLPPGFGACTPGASITSSLIGTVGSGGTLTNSIKACSPTCSGSPGCVVCPDAGVSNAFEARVQNLLPAATGGASHAVRAKFRIAEWGSTIANWQFASWKKIEGISDTIFTDDVTTLTNPPWAWSYDPVANQGTISFTCSAPNYGYCPLLTNADGYKHQCMLVELASGPSPANVDFTTSAVYRNMNFVGLSKSVVPATISIKGLQQVTGQAVDRDVYLYVQRRNMPDHGEKPLWLKQSSMARARSYAEVPPVLPEKKLERPSQGKPSSATTKDGKNAVKGEAKDPSARDSKAVPEQRQKESGAANAPESGAVGYPIGVLDLPTLTGEQALATVWPTYKVFAYYDSGRTTKVRGKSYKVLEPMVPFGFHLDHEGPFYGFTHELEGLDGLVVTKLADDYYKIRVPKEGSVRVQTTLTAEERPRAAGCPSREICDKCYKRGLCNCRLSGPSVDEAWVLALVAGMALLVVARHTVRRRRRRDGRR